VISVGLSAPITSITVATVKHINAINKNIPFILNSASSDLRLVLASKNPVIKRMAIDIRRYI